MTVLEARTITVGYAESGARHRGGRDRNNAGDSAARVLFRDLDLSISDGRFVVILGPNGSGKSTLIRSLAGMQPLLAGESLLLGKDVGRLDARERALRLALVLTERFDAGWFDVFDIVAFGRYAHDNLGEELRTGDVDIVRASLSAVGMLDFERRLFAELSDGEKQKVLIARALAQSTPFLILDEPTAFLDAPARSEVFHLLKKQAREGKAVLMSTHEVDLALREADEVWLVDRHRGIIVGAPEELVLSGAVGAAFDGPDLSFDAASARFIARSSQTRASIAVSGDEAVGLAWTLRLVERLGMSIEKGPGGFDAEIKVLAGAGNSPRLSAVRDEGRLEFTWIARRRNQPSPEELGSLSEVEAFLRQLPASRPGEGVQPNL